MDSVLRLNQKDTLHRTSCWTAGLVWWQRNFGSFFQSSSLCRPPQNCSLGPIAGLKIKHIHVYCHVYFEKRAFFWLLMSEGVFTKVPDQKKKWLHHFSAGKVHIKTLTMLTRLRIKGDNLGWSGHKLIKNPQIHSLRQDLLKYFPGWGKTGDVTSCTAIAPRSAVRIWLVVLGILSWLQKKKWSTGICNWCKICLN